MKHERFFLKKLCIITYVSREIMPSFCEAALARSLISQWELISLGRTYAYRGHLFAYIT